MRFPGIAMTRLQITIVSLMAVWTQAALAGSSNSLMDISNDGRLLACSNRDSGSVTFVDLTTNKVIREVQVGKKPEGVSFVGTTHNLACCVYGDDRVVVIDADSGNQIAKIDVFDEPYGVISNRDGSRLFVTLDYPGRVLEIVAETLVIVREIEAGNFVRGIAISPDEQTLFITEYYTARVRSIDASTGNMIHDFPGASTDNLARQLVVHPKRDKAYVGHIRSRVRAAHGNGSIFPYVSIIDTVPRKGESSRTRVPMDSFRGTLTTANPWEVAISPDGKRIYAIFGGTDDLFICDTVDDDYNEIQYNAYLRVGRNPRAVRVAPDGRSFFIYNALDFEVVRYNARTLKVVQTIRVCENPLSDEVWLGKVLFYSANQPMASRRWISCAGCHPDGDSDGRTWQNPEGLRSTPPLAGLAWTHPLHWSADRDETQDFEHTIRGPLMQGRGLVKGAITESLGKPLKGKSRELDALAAYTNSHTFSLSPFAKHGLTESAKRGRDLFFSKQTRCAECHSGPMLSDSQPGRFIKHDVGTGDQDKTELMGPKYDTPTLNGVYRSAPYLHHGKVATLRDVLTTGNPGDRHGVTSPLTDTQVTNLVDFLKSLPYESPEAQAQQAGLTKVDR
jgi:YVTN family beta-propeller protein